MGNNRSQYLARQKAFWNVTDEKIATYQRIYADGTESEIRCRTHTQQSLAHMLEGIHPESDWTLLEIGCGNGRLMLELSRLFQFQRLIGIDISESMISFARKNLAYDPRIELFVNSGCDLAMVQDDLADFVYANDVFIHLFDYDIIVGYFREVHRVLKRDGVFRFNINRFDPDTAFGNSLGGRFAKFTYRCGLLSAGRHRWEPRQGTGFHGNQFMIREIRHALKQGLFPAAEIYPEGIYLWCTVRKIR